MDRVTDFKKTITAPATAVGMGSIAIIRVSGPQAINAVSGIFHGKNLTSVSANTIHFGKIIRKGKIVDQVMISVFHAPHSYTGENYLEISCHANPYIVDDIMEILLAEGLSFAKPGEFTLRAFLNGKMDLSQAEAVAALIEAKSRIGIRNSLEQLNGRLAQQILDIKERLIELTALMEIDLDFSEENLEIATVKDIQTRLQKQKQQLLKLRESYNYAKLLEGGLRLTIIGEPNVGKSTLLNQLLGEERAITSHVPGTTRDTLHENIVIQNVLFKLIDTAGLRSTHDELEQEGIRRTHSQIALSDLVLLVVDASQKINQSSIDLISDTVRRIPVDLVLVANKIDLEQNKKAVNLLKKLKKPIVAVSAKNGFGIDKLKEEIIHRLSDGFEQQADELIITSQRQREVIDATVKSLDRAIQNLIRNQGYELIVLDLRQALNALGEITGETVTDDILNKIFSNFCIGK